MDEEEDRVLGDLVLYADSLRTKEGTGSWGETAINHRVQENLKRLYRKTRIHI